MQMAGVSEKEASVQVGCTPEVMRQHYERLDGMLIAKRNAARRPLGILRPNNPDALCAPRRAARTESSRP